MNDKQYIKMSELVDSEFTIQSVDGFKYKLWDVANHKMMVSDNWEKGYKKVYTLQTDRGQLDVGQGQMGSLLEPIVVNGKADLIGRTFHVKSNGKTGMEIRYFFNPKDTRNEPEDAGLDDDQVSGW